MKARRSRSCACTAWLQSTDHRRQADLCEQTVKATVLFGHVSLHDSGMRRKNGNEPSRGGSAGATTVCVAGAARHEVAEGMGIMHDGKMTCARSISRMALSTPTDEREMSQP